MAGITLIETMLYLGLVVLVLGAVFSYGWNVMGLSVKSRIAQGADETARLVAERVVAEIHAADSVDQGNSNFGDMPAKLTLQTAGDTVTISVSGNQLWIRRGAGSAIALNAADFSIKNFIFTQQVSATDETQFVGFSFDVEAAYPGSDKRSEYQYVLPIRAGSALRTTH